MADRGALLPYNRPGVSRAMQSIIGAPSSLRPQPPRDALDGLLCEYEQFEVPTFRAPCSTLTFPAGDTPGIVE